MTSNHLPSLALALLAVLAVLMIAWATHELATDVLAYDWSTTNSLASGASVR